MRSRIIVSWLGSDRSSASSGVGAATALTVRNVRGDGFVSEGRYCDRYSSSARSRPCPEKWFAVVDPYQGGLQLQRPLQFRPVMNLHQHIHPHLGGNCCQLAHLVIIQRRDDQQDGVRTDSPGFDHLVGVHREILAQYRQLAGRACLLQVAVSPLEKVDIGEYRQAARAAGLVTGGNLTRLEIRANHPLAGGGLLHFRDHRRLRGRDALLQGPGKTADGRLFRNALLETAQGIPLAPGTDFLALARQDLA